MANRSLFSACSLGVMGSVLLPAGAIAAEPLRLTASSKWHVNYAADSCRMGRSFGTGDNEVVLIFDRFQPGAPVYLTLSGKPAKVRSAVRKIVIHFGPGEPEQESPFDVATRGEGIPTLLIRDSVLVAGKEDAPDEKDKGDEDAFLRTPPPAIDPARNAKVNSVEFRVPGKPPLLLDMGAMDKPLAALTACTDDLLRGWNIDVEAHQSLSRMASPSENPGKWMRPDDYPDAMRYEGIQGLVYFRLIVDEAGKPKSCHIQQSTRPQEFDDAVCKGIMKRASFAPALDKAGKPVLSYYLNRVRFKM